MKQFEDSSNSYFIPLSGFELVEKDKNHYEQNMENYHNQYEFNQVYLSHNEAA